MGECCDHSSAFIIDWIFFILSCKKGMHEHFNEFEFSPDPTTPTMELAALEGLKKSKSNFVTTLSPSSFVGSSSFFQGTQVTRKTIKSRISLKFDKIRPSTAELAALESSPSSSSTFRTTCRYKSIIHNNGSPPGSWPAASMADLTSDLHTSLSKGSTSLSFHSRQSLFVSVLRVILGFPGPRVRSINMALNCLNV